MTNTMKMTRACDELVNAYYNYREVMYKFCKETGFNMDVTQTIASYEEDAAFRDKIVERLVMIDGYYNNR